MWSAKRSGLVTPEDDQGRDIDNGPQVRALLVENNEGDALLFARHASRIGGFSVSLSCVSTPAQAHAALARGGLDMAFCDLDLESGVSGLDIMRRAREQGVNTPFVIVTGAGDEAKAVEAMKSGAYDYINKDDLSPDLLEKTIRWVTERTRLEHERDEAVRRLAELSATDELTGIANRRRFVEKSNEEISRSCRSGRPFALLMLDLDHFKDVNDRFGHRAGDCALRECAAALKATLRPIDLVARYGGDEFLIVLSEADIETARVTGNRIREVVRALREPCNTVSVGAAVWRPGDDLEAMMSRADKALYEAKAQGRDRVVEAQ